MPIVDNFPRKIPLASKDKDGLMSKDDKILLDSLADKKNILMKITGRKVHSFDTIRDMISAINLVDSEVVMVLGDNSILDDNLIRIYEISSNNTPVNNNTVLTLAYNNLYAKLLLSISTNTDTSSAIATMNDSVALYSTVTSERISNLVGNTDVDTPSEVVDARVDENGTVYTCLKDRLDAISDKIDSYNIKRYGVSFSGSNPNGIRLEDAIDKVANPSTDIMKGVNDFDSIYPWSDMIRCNGYYNSYGIFVVTAYDGEPGFSVNGSNRDVYVEIPKFFIKEEINESSESMYISDTELDGYRLPSKFIRSNSTTVDKVYISAYALSENGYSVSNTPLFTGNYNSILNLCKSRGDNYTGFNVQDLEIIRYLFTVEYATRDVQSIMAGAYLSNTTWDNGSTNSVLGPSGSPNSNISGEYPCRYRYIENPWGNMWTILYQVVINNNKILYNDEEVGYTLPKDSGYISKLGYDSNYPELRLASDISDGSSYNYYTDEYIASKSSNTTAFMIGGNVGTEFASGGLYATNTSEPLNSSLKASSRLSYIL